MSVCRDELVTTTRSAPLALGRGVALPEPDEDSFDLLALFLAQIQRGLREAYIVDAVRKRDLLEQHRQALGLRADQVIATGDGANDLEMMEAVGLSVAYRAKPKVRDQALVAIDMGGLDRLLELFDGE